MNTPVKVLLIEDNPGDVRLITTLLADAGGLVFDFELQCVDSLAAGVERLRAGGVDVVLLDLGLPESRGLETVQRLCAHAQRMPALVVFSSLDDEDIAVQALQSGAQDYLVKGKVDSTQLLRAIRYAMGRHLAEAALTNELERTRELATERANLRLAESESEGLRRLLDERDQILRERGELLELLAHEVRQPLNNASAALQNASAAMVGSGDTMRPEIRASMERAQHVLDHVMGTLNNTLAAATLLAVGERGTLAETDLDTLVGLVVRDIGLDERARVAVEPCSELRTAQLQPMMMRLALCNLLVNALAYSPPGSPVRLRVSDSENPPSLCFEVMDLGSGIAPALQPTVLDKGTRGQNARPGTGAGLGLYIVRRVVELHRGRIELLPNAPRGTIVRICIPQGVEA